MTVSGFAQLDSVNSVDIEILMKGEDWSTAIYVRKGESKPFTGVAFDYYYNTTQIEQAYQIINGKSDSCWARGYYENGQLGEEIWYYDRMRHGKFITWYKSGQIEEQGFYAKDKKIDKWFGFHENGDSLYTCFYINGKLEGEWKIWDVGMELTFFEIYSNGIKVKKVR